MNNDDFDWGDGIIHQIEKDILDVNTIHQTNVEGILQTAIRMNSGKSIDLLLDRLDVPSDNMDYKQRLSYYYLMKDEKL